MRAHYSRSFVRKPVGELMPLQEQIAEGTAAGTPSELRGAEARAIIIAPARRRAWSDLRDLYEYRELFYFLGWRDVKVRYKQTTLGVGWAVLQPVIAMLIFTAVFGKFARIPSDSIPYPIFAYTALLGWNLFAGALHRSVTSVVASSHLISKVYFPRLIIPLASTLSGVVDFIIGLAVLFGLMVWYEVKPTPGLLLLPVIAVFGLACALAVGLWLSALNVAYRDVGQTIPFLIQVWMYASPVVYPASLVPEKWLWLYSLNPMVVVIEGFRWALLGQGTLSPATVFTSALLVLILLFGGVAYFRRLERTFADVI